MSLPTLAAIKHSSVFVYVFLMVTETSLNSVILPRCYKISSWGAHCDKNTASKSVVGTPGHPSPSSGCFKLAGQLD